MHLHLFLFLYYRLVSLNPIIPFYSDTALLARILRIRTLSYLIMMCLVICAAITKKRPSKKGVGLVAIGFFQLHHQFLIFQRKRSTTVYISSIYQFIPLLSFQFYLKIHVCLQQAFILQDAMFFSCLCPIAQLPFPNNFYTLLLNIIESDQED